METISVIEESHAKDMKEFDESKIGVKGLVDSGITKIPKFFIQPPQIFPISSPNTLQIPIIDVQGSETNGLRRKKIVEEICEASEKWGFFQMVNHGIPIGVMEAILEGAKNFHEQAKEAKMEIYSRNQMQRVRYYSNEHLHVAKAAANWRDTLSCVFQDDKIDSDLVPIILRREVEEYMKCMIKLKESLCELLSEALGLSRDYFASGECMKSNSLLCHYYPICPQPNLTLGLSKHTDQPFLTVLLQDKIGGLQVLHQNHWVDVLPVQGALIVNMGDFMQLITNNKFKSVEHRVLAASVEARVSIACFFIPSTKNISQPYGPIKELLSDNNPPLYKEVLFKDFAAAKGQRFGLDGSHSSVLPLFEL